MPLSVHIFTVRPAPRILTQLQCGLFHADRGAEEEEGIADVCVTMRRSFRQRKSNAKRDNDGVINEPLDCTGTENVDLRSLSFLQQPYMDMWRGKCKRLAWADFLFNGRRCYGVR